MDAVPAGSFLAVTHPARDQVDIATKAEESLTKSMGQKVSFRTRERRGQEAGLASLARQGFGVADVIRAYQLIYSFTIGFCIEEQAVAQAGDDRYSLSRRAERKDDQPPSETPPEPVNRVDVQSPGQP
jgi:hypothetical protein